MTDRTLSYTIKEGSLPEYVLIFSESGLVNGLMKTSSFRSSEGVTLSADTKGLCRLLTHMDGLQRPRALTEPLIKTLVRLRQVMNAVHSCSLYLIDDEYLSLDVDDIYFDERNDTARLLPKPRPEPLFDKLLHLCKDLSEACPTSGADIVATRLLERNEKSLLDCRGIIRFLSAFESELFQ